MRQYSGGQTGKARSSALRYLNLSRSYQAAGWLAGLLVWLVLSSLFLAAHAQVRSYTPEVTDQLRQGQDMIKAGKLDSARQIFTHILEVSPKCPEAFQGIGVTYLREGHNKKAEEALRSALELDPFNVNVLNNLGTATYRQRKLDESITYYQQALQLSHDDDYTIHVNLGNSYQDKHESQQAQEQYETAIRLKGDYAPAYLGLSRLFYDLHKLDDAETQARNALRFKPDSAMAYYNLGLIEASKHHYHEAELAFRQSLKYESDPEYIKDTKETLRKLAGVANQSVVTGAVATTATSTGAAPAQLFPPAQTVPALPVETKEQAIARVTNYLEERDWKGAERLIKALLENFGPDAVLLNNLGYAYAHEGNPFSNKIAVDQYRRAIELKKGAFSAAEYNLGQVFRQMGDNAEAERAFRRAIEDAKVEHTTVPLAQNALGMLLKQKGDLMGADAAYRRALLQSGSELPVVHYNLGILLEKMERTREAVREYKAYLSLSPAGVNAKQARSRLRRLGIEPPA